MIALFSYILATYALALTVCQLGAGAPIRALLGRLPWLVGWHSPATVALFTGLIVHGLGLRPTGSLILDLLVAVGAVRALHAGLARASRAILASPP